MSHLLVCRNTICLDFFLVVQNFNRQRQWKKRRRPASKKEATPTETPTICTAGARHSQKYRPITFYWFFRNVRWTNHGVETIFKGWGCCWAFLSRARLHVNSACKAFLQPPKLEHRCRWPRYSASPPHCCARVWRRAVAPLHRIIPPAVLGRARSPMTPTITRWPSQININCK